MVKPDGVRRGLVGEVIGRPERKGLRLEAMRMLTIDGELAETHYAEHVERLITTTTALRPGWPAVASKADTSTVPPTISDSRPSRTASTSTICMPPCSTYWASITSNSPTVMPAGIFD